jgi:hypothetical protein
MLRMAILAAGGVAYVALAISYLRVLQRFRVARAEYRRQRPDLDWPGPLSDFFGGGLGQHYDDPALESLRRTANFRGKVWAISGPLGAVLLLNVVARLPTGW